jgi:vanillate O-demethylase ferredoxin subunit
MNQMVTTQMMTGQTMTGQTMTGQPGWQSARLVVTRQLASEVRLFEIEPAAGFAAPSPGSHIRVMVETGGRPDVRCYSTVGPCRDGRYRIAVKRHADSRGGSAYLWGLSEGALLTVSPPASHFELSYGRPGYLLIAGGIGITPIYSMALALAEAQAPFRLLYACRRAEDLALADDLRDRIGDRLHIFLDERGDSIDLAAEIARLAPDGELYVCGPMGLLDAARTAWRVQGRPVDRLRFETFGNSGRFASEAFSVRIAHLERTIEVAANQTILSALEAAGIDMISDCRRGECGVCAVTIVDAAGVVDHRDVFFSDAEHRRNEKLCVCVSRVAGGGVTIDTGARPGIAGVRPASAIPNL